MATDDVQTNLRLPSALKERLQASAETSGRSLSAEVAYRIGEAYELSKVVDQLRAQLELAVERVAYVERHAEMGEKEVHDAVLKVATLEAQLQLMKQTRTSDIEAATKHLSEKVDSLLARALAAESALKSQSAMTNAMAQFVVGAVDMAGPQPGVSNDVFRLMKATAVDVKTSGRATFTEPMEQLMVMLMAIQALPKGRDLSEFVTTVMKHFREGKLDGEKAAAVELATGDHAGTGGGPVLSEPPKRRLNTGRSRKP